MKRLIVTADDFGLAIPVNEAVEEGHRRGILTAASLMVTGDAAADAVARARQMPKLGVGLHLVLVDGVPVLPPEQLPDLVGRDGRFRTNVLAQGVRIFCLPAARRQVAAEIRAQLEAFRATGLALDHVNAHHHFHLHPTIQQELLRQAGEFGIRAVRLPLEPPLASWRAGGRRLAWLSGFLEGRHARRLKRRLDAAGIRRNDQVFGLGDTGGMTSARVLRYLEDLPDGVSEIYFHPATQRPSEWPAHYDCRGELAALIDPAAAAVIARRGIETMPFAGLERAA
ncbi:MAG TPA: hopanoid biosynthesis-associated protein HpnK [Stellaceae bacterium]|nr:hopanoid biosynthesis-associated protein HpnK [Stellaceae bacterium]